MININQEEWTHYLTRSFNLLGCSLWARWYSSKPFQDVFKIRFDESILLEKERNIIAHYKKKNDLNLFLESAKDLITFPIKLKSFLEEGITLNNKIKLILDGKITVNLLQSIELFYDFAVKSTVLPYIVGKEMENSLDFPDIVNLIKKLKNVSYYNEYINQIIIPLVRLELGVEDAELLTIKEIMEKDVSSLEKRRMCRESNQLFMLYLKENEEEVIWKDDFTSFLECFSEDQLIIIDKDELEGQTTFSGKVRGLVKIVLGNNNDVDFEEGSVFVTISTNPSITPLLKKASAIVTSEGGLLSHAAIISRELKIPCIVGVKGATQVFKDGDLVEVDADKGVVRKINNVRSDFDEGIIRKIEKGTASLNGKMNMPSKEECYRLYEKYKVPQNIREHSEKVTEVCIFLAQKFIEKGLKVNIELIEKAGLLHDMFKIAVIKNTTPNKYHTRAFTSEELKMREELREKYPGKYENEIFYEIFHEKYPELAELILNGTNPISEERTLEEKILNYADARVLRDEIVSLDERFVYLREYYEEEDGFWDRRLEVDKKLEQDILEKIDILPEELKEMVENGQ
ncbi:MAG: PEP-utilizing enzyme [Candidatus Woesearchaeota archaeon]